MASAFHACGLGTIRTALAATAPTMVNFDNGMSVAVAPGESFAPGSTVGGIEVTATLDRRCGNL